MLVLALILAFSVPLGDPYPTGPLTYGLEGETPEERMFQVLLGLDLSPRSRPSAPLHTDPSVPPLPPEDPRSAWRWLPEMLHPEMKKRHNLASYNLNSFGLRYGK